MKHAVAAAGTVLFLMAAARAEEAPERQNYGIVNEVYPWLTSGALSRSRLATLPAGVLLQAGEVEVGAGAVDEEVARAPQELRAQLEKNRFFVLERVATERLLVQAARQAGKVKEGVSDKEAIQAYFDQLVGKAEVDDGEVKSFYEENKDMVGGAPFEQVRGQIKEYLLQQKKEAIVYEHIRTLGDRMQIRLDNAWTEAQVKSAMDNPVDKARTSGMPTMADFGSHGCVPCDMMTPILEDMKKKHAGKANVLFVPVGGEQILAARYGVSSIPVQVFFDKQGKEIFRHTGYFAQDECEKWLKKAAGE